MSEPRGAAHPFRVGRVSERRPAEATSSDGPAEPTRWGPGDSGSAGADERTAWEAPTGAAPAAAGPGDRTASASPGDDERTAWSAPTGAAPTAAGPGDRTAWTSAEGDPTAWDRPQPPSAEATFWSAPGAGRGVPAGPGTWWNQEEAGASPAPPPGSQPSLAPSCLRPGMTLGTYRIDAELGRGGMGAVFRAWDPAAGRHVALKVVLDPLEGPLRERFVREGQATAALDHPHVVRVHSAGEVEGIPFLAYELVEGARTLRDAFRVVDRAARVSWVRDAAAGLGYAHARGLVHRDVKPDNLLVDAHGRLRVADFGLVTAPEAARLTQTGAVVGTPAYMAPEQDERDRVGPWTDVWALGVVLYEALTQRRPFAGESLYQLRYEIQELEPPAPRELDPTIPAALEAVCLRCLRKEPEERYSDGAALAAELERALSGEQVAALPSPRRRRRVGVGVVLPAALVGAAAALAAGLGRGVLGGGATPPASALPPLELELTLDPTPEVVGSEEVELTGRVPDVTLIEVAALGHAPAAVGPAGTFALRLALQPGQNVFELVGRDAAGRATRPTSVRVHRAPAWFAALAPSQRPPLPLREGLTIREEQGEYVWTRDGSILVWVPPGRFTLPSGTGLGVRRLAATRTRGVFLGKYEVTWRQFLRYCEAAGVKPPKRRALKLGPDDDPGFAPPPDHPVARITWDDARAYCRHHGLRLPTELEWAHAARGAEGRRYAWGSTPPDSRTCNRAGELDGFAYTSPVGSFPRDVSPVGCLDMGGNVAEWTADAWAELPEALPPDSTSTPRDSDRTRVVRGGDWRAEYVLSFETGYREPKRHDRAHMHVGFRVALDPE